MSELAATLGRTRPWDSEAAKKGVSRRYAADRRLKYYGIAAIAFAIFVLAVLIVSLVITGYSAFVQSKVELKVFVDPQYVKADDVAAGNFRVITRQAFANYFPDVTNRREQTELQRLLTAGAQYIVRDYIVSHPDSVGKTITVFVSLSDPFDQLHKGVVPSHLDALHPGRAREFRSLQSRGVVQV
jgi:phosphate transport system permease protein